MNKPIIGILSKHQPKIDGSRPNTYIRDEIKQAIFDNGGIAIGVISTEKGINDGNDNWGDNLSQEERNNLIAQVNLCDGIILQGGPNSDNYEIIVAKYCYDNNIPCLGICAGQNNIVRALGGTTYRIPNPEDHDKTFNSYVHDIKINEDSRFYDIVKTNQMMVNSRHKMTVKECPLLEKVAFCPDGYPDVVESKDKKFYVGVRFHPESLYLDDEFHNRIFKSFIDTCANRYMDFDK